MEWQGQPTDAEEGGLGGGCSLQCSQPPYAPGDPTVEEELSSMPRRPQCGSSPCSG